MDDANLSKLEIDQPGLHPAFNRDIVDYYLTVPFHVEKLNIKAVKNDSGASLSIKSNTGYGDEVKLQEGENKIIIEVTSEDGTVKKYFINTTRLLISDAKLKMINLINQSVELKPSFKTELFEYNCLVDYKTSEVRMSLDLFDSNCIINVTANNIKLDKNINSEYSLKLSYGYTELVIIVTSPNKLNNQNYTVKINRSVMPRLATFLNLNETLQFEDPFSLAPLYCPVKLSNLYSTNPILFSKNFLNIFQKMCRSSDHLNIISLSINQNDQIIPCFNTENKLSDLKAKIPYFNGDYSTEAKLIDISELIDVINKQDESKINEDEIENHSIPSINKIPASLPAYQTKPWEKHYMIIYDETNVQKLIEKCDENFEKYLDLTLNPHSSVKLFTKDTNDSPLYYLNMCLYYLATSIKFKSNNYEIHFKFGAFLEEKNFYINIFGKEKKEEKDDPGALSLNTQNKLISDESKEEEISAICSKKGLGDNPTDADKLKALDNEYHYLMENNQSHKAEQVQLLYQFKSKKINESSKSSTVRMRQADDYLIQSHFKYLDGLGVFLESKTTNFNIYLTIGRSYCMIGDYDNALIYLKQCLNWSDQQSKILARFYYAFALSKNKELLASNLKLISCFIANGLQTFLKSLSQSLSNKKILIAHDHFSIFNKIFLEGFLTLGKIKTEYDNIKFNFISAEESFKYCAWLSCIALNEINNRTLITQELVKTSNLIKDLIRILIESHANLINLNKRIEPSELDDLRILQTKRCVNLINIIRTATERDDKYILKLQEITAQRLVFADPFDSYYLLLLGCSKLELYDYLIENVKSSQEDYLTELLNESKIYLVTSIELNNDNKINDVPSLISDQKWWKEFLLEEEKKLSPPPASTKVEERPASKNNKTKITTAPTKSSVSSTPSNKIPANKKSTPVPVVAPSSKTTNQSKTPAKTKADCKIENQSQNSLTNTANKPSSADKAKKQVEDTLTERPKQLNNYKRKNKLSYDKNLTLNQANLYLARVYTRLKEINTATSFYDKVIKMEPNNRDSYIELAKVLRDNNDLEGAINVYANYPVIEQKNESQKFDDAFIFGELVTLLIKEKKYDDARLPKYLILWAKIMGIAIIEKYVNILDKANKTKICKEIYAGINNKKIDDPDLVQFFKFKGWF